MLYKKLTFVSFIASIFSPIRYANAQSSYTVGATDVTCAAGLETCTITCNQGSDFSGNINCNDAKNCVFDCVAEKCTLDARINAQNAQTLTITSSGFQCMKWSQIDAGNAESVTIRCTGDMCMKNSYINARNAQFLRIEVPTGGDFGQAGKSSETYNDMYVDCPRGGSAAGTYAAPCVLEVTGSGTLGGGVHVITGGGVPRDFQLIGGVSTEVYVACNGYSPATPFDTYDQGDTSVYDQLSDITGSGHSCYAAAAAPTVAAAPTTKTPTAATPTTATPTTADPTTAAPTTANPTTTNPTTANPTTANPTTASPTSAAPTTANPTTGLPTKGPTPPPVEDQDQEVGDDDDDDQGGDGDEDGDQQNVDETPAEEDAGPLVSFLPGNQFEQLIIFCTLALICACCSAALCLFRLCAKRKRKKAALKDANMASLSEFSQAPSSATAPKNRSVPMQALRSVSSMSDDDGDRDERRDTVQADEGGEEEPASPLASAPASPWAAGSLSSQSGNAQVPVAPENRSVPPPPPHPPQPPAVPMDAVVGMAAMQMQMPAAGMMGMGGMGGMAPGMMSMPMPMMNMAAMMQQTNMMGGMPGMQGMPSNMMFGGGGEQGGDVDVGGELPSQPPQVRAEEDIETYGADDDSDDDNDDQYDPQPGPDNGMSGGALPPHNGDELEEEFSEELYDASPVNNDQPLVESHRTDGGYAFAVPPPPPQ